MNVIMSELTDESVVCILVGDKRRQYAWSRLTAGSLCVQFAAGTQLSMYLR